MARSPANSHLAQYLTTLGVYHMNVSESKFRQILREEARRVLREELSPSVTSPAPATPGAVTGNAVAGQKETANRLRNTIEQNGVLNPATKTQLVNAINNLINKGRGANVARFVTAAGAVSSADDPEGKVKLGALLAALMGKQSTGSGGMRTVADNAHIGFGNDPQSADRLKNEIITANPGKMGTSIVDELVALAGLAPAPVASAPVAGARTGTGSAGSKYHTIVAGDSISKVAAANYNPPVPLSNASMPIYTEIATASGIKVNSTLQIGQKLVLPAKLSGGKYTLK